MAELIQNVAIVIGFVVVAALGYYMYTQSSMQSSTTELDEVTITANQFLC